MHATSFICTLFFLEESGQCQLHSPAGTGIFLWRRAGVCCCQTLGCVRHSSDTLVWDFAVQCFWGCGVWACEGSSSMPANYDCKHRQPYRILVGQELDTRCFESRQRQGSLIWSFGHTLSIFRAHPPVQSFVEMHMVVHIVIRKQGVSWVVPGMSSNTIRRLIRKLHANVWYQGRNGTNLKLIEHI